MVRRASEQTGSAAYHRRQQEREEDQAVVQAIGDRMEALFGRMEAGIQDLKVEVRRVEQKTDTLSNRVKELEMQVQEAREAVHRARAATPALTVSAGRQIVSEVKGSWWAKAGAILGVLIALYTLASAAPKIARGVNHAWAYITHADGYEPATVPKK